MSTPSGAKDFSKKSNDEIRSFELLGFVIFSLTPNLFEQHQEGLQAMTTAERLKHEWGS
ncbi:hypothetical protein [Paraburkholderia terrae]